MSVEGWGCGRLTLHVTQVGVARVSVDERLIILS